VTGYEFTGKVQSAKINSVEDLAAEASVTQYEQLRMLLGETPYLVANPCSGALFFAGEPSVSQHLSKDVGPHTIFNLAIGLEKVAEELGRNDREFGLGELATFAGMSYSLMYNFVNVRKVIRPMIRDFGGSGQGDACEARFSWLDAYTSILVGMMRRAGFRPAKLKRVQPLIALLIDEQADWLASLPSRN